MGRTSITGGVTANGQERIQFTFRFEGARYRPTMPILPSEANLRRARQQLEPIKRSIANGTISFAEEFPDFRDFKKVLAEGCPRTCCEVFDMFLARCQSRVNQGDLATVTVATYRRVLNGIWRPQIGNFRLLDVRHSALLKIADEPDWSKKTFNNAISVLRQAFKFGFRDDPDRHDPTSGLMSARIRKRDRPIIDPFTIHEAEKLIAAIHRDWGEAQGNYDEFRFFTGMRPLTDRTACRGFRCSEGDFNCQQGTRRGTRQGLDQDWRGSAHRALPAGVGCTDAAARMPRGQKARPKLTSG
ncbi:MAG TPA: DUF3596 domain-containing protein [Steroidobacteraceae bacterium]|jgi:integrase|nr:DUF3596 domain-containing protein [Steroidobacteraceae bacterium]